MKTKFLLLSLSLLLIGCNDSDPNKERFNRIEESHASSNGLLVCDGAKKHFGKFNRGDTIKCEFVFYNTGIEPVKIIDSKASCNCTELKFSRMTIKEKDTTYVTMIIITNSKSVGQHSSGALIKTNGKRTFYNLSAEFEIK